MDPWQQEKGDVSPSVSTSNSSISSCASEGVDIPAEVLKALHKNGLEVNDKGIVNFAPDSPTHPRRRGLARKLYDTTLIFFFEFIVTLLSIAGSSIAPIVAKNRGINDVLATFCITTTYMLGQAIGSLVFPPVSESFGVRGVYLLSTFGYSVCCFGMAMWPQLWLIVVGRFWAGAFAAMPAASAGAIENLWDMSSRIFVVHIWIASAVLGLAVGPAISTQVAMSTLGWKFMFWIGGAITGVTGLLCLGLKESRPSKVLRQHVSAIAKSTGFDGLAFEEDDASPTLKNFLRNSLWQPQRLFFTEPIVTLIAIMASTVYGLVYLFSECLDIVYVEGFGFDGKTASLVLLPMIGGVALSFLPRIYDVQAARWCRESGNTWEPEHKLFGFYIAAPVLSLGMWLFSSTVPPLTHIVPWPSISSIILFGYCVVEFDNVLSGYLTDTYASYAASANASMSFLRCVMSGVFPLCGKQMFQKLGSNIALWILAFLATLFCFVAVVFWLYAKSIRERSPLAEKTWSSSKHDKEKDVNETARSVP